LETITNNPLSGNNIVPNVNYSAAPSGIGAGAGPGTGIGNSNGNGQAMQNEEVDFTNFLKHASNPCVVLFTLIFKALSIISFLILNMFLKNEALVFILVVIFSAFDFWFVKNVSGR
jgi:hypothetical protein